MCSVRFGTEFELYINVPFKFSELNNPHSKVIVVFFSTIQFVEFDDAF